ncbi:MAG: hypothetical protein ABR605_04750 [Desulfurivibrionaceae bacterium]
MEKISKNTGLIILGVLLTFVLGGMDWLTGHNLNFFVFYFLPVFFAAWFLGSLGAIFFAILCATVWFGADFLNGHIYQSDIYIAWNTMIRFFSFLAIGWSVSALKRALTREKAISEKLRQSMSEIKVLQAFLPICSQCKKIRDEQGEWQDLEGYIGEHANTKFSHGYCPECYKRARAEAGLQDKQDLADSK